jgi:predicted TIM-barrel fold metal-dependent hydrolase
VRALLQGHPDLLGELSYRPGLTEGGGRLSPAWRALLSEMPERFMLGSDTWINERWFGYDTIFKEYRGWLAQLPSDQAQRIASGNALRLFGLRRE